MGHFIKRPLIYPGHAETHKIHLFITYAVVKVKYFLSGYKNVLTEMRNTFIHEKMF